MACHSCDLTALGCSGCDSHHTSSFHYGCGYGSPLLSSKTFLQEFTQHLLAGLLADGNPSKPKIDASVAKGPLGKYGRCRLSGAIQIVGAELSQKLGLEILQKVEKVLEDDEADRKKARERAEEEARHRAKLIAIDTATKIATEIATNIANTKVQDALDTLKVSQDLQEFCEKNIVEIGDVPPAEIEELKKGVEEASKRAPAVIKQFHIPRSLLSQVPRFALYNFLVMCDNSGSMTHEASRITTLEATVRALFNVREELGSKRQFSIIPFVGPAYENVKSKAEVERALASFEYNGGDGIKPFRERILDKLKDLAHQKRLNPTMSVFITDGQMDVDRLAKAIVDLKQTLTFNGYHGPRTLFLICRVGSDKTAATSLLALKTNPKINDMVALSEDQLDSKLTGMQNNLDHYAGWVVGELLRAMDLQAIAS